MRGHALLIIGLVTPSLTIIMPKEKRRRTELHGSSVKPLKRPFPIQEGTAEASDVPGNDILHALSAPESSAHFISKRGKQELKREAFVKKITSKLLPYSKSHTRRLRTKAKEQIGGGLSDIQAAITELAEEAEASLTAPDATSSTAAKIKPHSNAGKIGRGKGLPFTASRRKRALLLEQMRQPAILSNKEFASKPFETIRTHAENTLVKHQVPI